MDRKDRLRKKAEEVADNLENGSQPSQEFEETLQYGNVWTMEWDDLIKLMTCYKLKKSGKEFGKPWGILERPAFVDLMTNILFEKTDKDFMQRDENFIYVYEFEAEHEGDINGIREELEDAGAEVIKAAANFADETGYAFFTVKDENVGSFEEEMGKLWRFKRHGKLEKRS